MSYQSCCRIVYQHRADNFDKWPTSTCDSGVIELHNVAAGPARDYAAVKAALTLPGSNSPSICITQIRATGIPSPMADSPVEGHWL